MSPFSASMPAFVARSAPTANRSCAAESFGLLGLEPGGLEVVGGGERVEGGGKQGGSPVAVRGTGYPRVVTWCYPFPFPARRNAGEAETAAVLSPRYVR